MRFVVLDFARVLAIALIVFFHVAGFFARPVNIDFPGIVLNLGEIGIILFIVLSGFLLQKHWKPVSYVSFIRQRFLRLYPVFLACLVFGSILFVFSGHFLSAEQFVCEASGFCFWLSNFFPNMVLATGWFIGTIFSLYLLFPLIQKEMQRDWLSCLVVLFLIELVSRMVLPIGIVKVFPFCRVFEFGLGIWLATKIPNSILLVLNPFQRFGRVMRWLSDASFPIFLLHLPLINFFGFAMGL